MVFGSQSGRPGRLVRDVQPVVLRVVLCAALWVLLTGGAPDSWNIGLPAVTLAVVLSVHLQYPRTRRISLASLLSFLAFFVLHSVRSGVQVAALVLRRRLELDPAILELELTLPDEGARVFLTNIVTLLPGSLACGLDGKYLMLHVLDKRWPVEREVRAAEAHVARLFGLGS